MAELTGQQLVELVQISRDAAIERLVADYRQEIHALCARISGNPSEADDLAQETFVNAYENLGGFRGDASPKTWLYRIAFNRSVSFKRRLKRWRFARIEDDHDVFETHPELGVDSPAESVERSDLADRAKRQLQQLPPRQRTAVVLRLLNELPYAEIAEVMGTSVGGAKANVHQGLRKLRDAMNDNQPVAAPRKSAALL